MGAILVTDGRLSEGSKPHTLKSTPSSSRAVKQSSSLVLIAESALSGKEALTLTKIVRRPVVGSTSGGGAAIIGEGGSWRRGEGTGGKMGGTREGSGGKFVASRRGGLPVDPRMRGVEGRWSITSGLPEGDIGASSVTRSLFPTSLSGSTRGGAVILVE